MRDGRLEASGHNWVEGQGSGPRIDKKDGEEEDQYDAMGNKIVSTKKKAKLTSRLVSPSTPTRRITRKLTMFIARHERRRRSVWLVARGVRRSSLTRMTSKPP